MGRFFKALFISAFLSLPALADIRTIGVSNFPKDMHIFAGQESASLFLKAALTRTLIKPRKSPNGDITYELDAASGFSTDGKFSKISFSLTDKMIFADGSPLEFEDLQYSMSHCRTEGLFANVTEALEKERTRGGIRSRIFEVSISIPGVEEYTSVLKDFSKCPLLDGESSKIFGRNLGVGNALIPSGKFKIGSFKSGSEYLLYRWDDGNAQPQSIAIKAFSESDQALSMLRSGALDVIADADEGTLEKARKDQTLAVVKCPQGMIVYRRGLSFECDPRLSLDSLIYTDVPS